MKTLIDNIEQLRKYVKINASMDWNTYRPFVRDAQEKYITPYFGNLLIESIQSNDADVLREKICRALGPFSLALATDELSINFGETGHTVTRTDKLAPASDAKIQKATESLFERAWHNLDQAIRLALSDTVKYVIGPDNDFARTQSTALFDNYTQFQERGLIDINNSPLTFSRLRMLIRRIEQTETFRMIPSGVAYDDTDKLLSALQAYTASRVAELYTNNPENKSLKDHPPIQFIKASTGDSVNYYTAQSSHWSGVINKILIDEHEQEDSSFLKWNDQDKKVFVANARRI